MDLAALIAHHKFAYPLQKQDENLIFRLFERSPMRAVGLDLVYDRAPEFTALLDCQNEHRLTFVARNSSSIHGFASVSWGRRWLNGTYNWCGYGGDLRTAPERGVIRRWRDFYGDFLEVLFSSPEFGPTRALLTAVLSDNKTAIRSLTGKKHGQKFRYDFLRKLNMVNLFMPKPWKRPRPTVGHVVSHGGDEQIRQWMAERHRQMHFGVELGTNPGNEWERRLSTWSGLDERNLLSVRDGNGKILAVAWPWSPSIVKRIKISAARLAPRALFAMLNALGHRGPRVGGVLETLYLTHLTFAANLNQEQMAKALQTLISAVYTSGAFSQHSIISFADQWNLVGQPELNGYIQQVVGVNLYNVCRSNDPPLTLDDSPIDFEMAVV